MKHTIKKRNFMIQGAILGLSSIIVRLIGVIYRIPLTNIIGDKGIGYYSVAFDIYQILLLLSSYSLPLAVSKMVSARIALGQYRRSRKILYNALAFAVIVGICAFLITFCLADFFAGTVMKVPQSAVALKVLAFALIILAVLGVLRGYFQGMGNMIPTAVSNIAEQILNAIVSVVAAGALFHYGSTIVQGSYDFSNAPEAFGAAGGTMGTVAGALLAMVLLLVWMIRYNKKTRYLLKTDQSEEESTADIVKILILTIVPVILNTAIYNLSSVVDKFIFSNIMIAKGMSPDTRDSLIGMFSGKYWLIVNIPIALSSALASALIPSVVSSKARKSRRDVISKVRSSIQMITLIAFPCAAGIGFLSRPIIDLLFPTSDDPGKIALMLSVGCLTVVLYCLSTITNSILQGIDRMRIPVFHSAFSLAVNAAVLALLLWLFNMDVFAWIIADMIFALLMCILNARSLRKYLRYRQEIRYTFIKPIEASIIMGILAFFFQEMLSRVSGHSFDIVITILFAVIVYVILLFAMRIINEKKLRMIPGGTRLVPVLKKLHLLR
ncbi:MAG: polysaccharide biosynthesis protein [Parasporobacterium sp.]|nr:polysaccharide biosynthesis protein [Parasporobacterium sp.]